MERIDRDVPPLELLGEIEGEEDLRELLWR